MKLGLGSKLGGGCRLGGGDAVARVLYRNLRGIAPHGFWPEDDAALRNVLLEGYSRIVEHGQLAADRLLRGIFPQSCGETLESWERLLRVVPQGDVSERVEAVIARWRGASPPRLRDIREALAPLLRPVWAWRDTFDDDVIHPLYERQFGEGNADETTSLVLTLPATPAEWPDDAVRISWPVNTIGDDVTLCARVTAEDVRDDSWAGIALLGRDRVSQGVFWGLTNTTGALRADVLLDGAFIVDAIGTMPALPVLPFWLIIQQRGTLFEFSTNTSPEPDSAGAVLHGSVEAPNLSVRHIALVARNYATHALASLTLGAWRYRQAKQEGNVTVLERTHADMSAWSATPEAEPGVLQGCVVRWAEDPGTYDLRNAQRVADTMSQAHTALHVGATGFMRCDDASSLCDRGALGR
jgi:hypothetical protein